MNTIIEFTKLSLFLLHLILKEHTYLNSSLYFIGYRAYLHLAAQFHTSIEADAAIRPVELECPSDNVITTTYRCQVENQWTDCSRSTCCPEYTYVAGEVTMLSFF